MNIVFDQKALLTLESIRVSPNRIFHCEPCQGFRTRTQVDKWAGKYFCKCGKEVQDITDTVDGEAVLNHIGRI